MNRNDARPLLKTVHEAIEELRALSLLSNDIEEFNKEWNAILDKYDINYNDLKRWDTIDHGNS